MKIHLIDFKTTTSIVRKIIFCCIGFLYVIILNGCINSGNSNNNNINNLVNIGSISSIPLINQQPGFTYMVVTNNANYPVKLNTTKINLNNQTFFINDTTNQYLDVSACTEIESHQSCKVKVFKPTTQISYLVTMNFSDNNGKLYGDSQIINSSTEVNNQDGFYYTNNNRITQDINQNTTMTIPVVLAEDYTQAEAQSNSLNTQLDCPKYTVGTLCTLFIKGTFNSNSSARVMLSGQNSIGSTVISTLAIGITPNNIANLITSGVNMVIDPAIATNLQQVWLSNKGLATATNLNIITGNPIAKVSSSDPNNCINLKSLAVGQSCSFFINATVNNNSGQSQVGINYFDGINNQNLVFNVIYKAPSTIPAMTLITNNNLLNIPINQGPYSLLITVNNTGSSTLSNIIFNISGANADMSTRNDGITNPCTNGISLNSGANCTVRLVYSPTTVQTGTVKVIESSTYMDNGGNTLTYSSASLAIPYSSTNTQNFVMVGDFGSVVSSVDGTTWSVKVNAPTTAAQGINAITSRNSTYVLGTSTGTLSKSTTGNGLFWSSAGNITGAGIINGLTTDNNENFYAATSSNSATTSGGIFRSTTLSGNWSSVYTAPPGAFGTNNGQVTNVVFLNNTLIGSLSGPMLPTGQRIVVSTSGGTWTLPTTNSSTSSYNASVYDGTRYYMWDSSGTVINTTSATGAWTTNTTSTGSITINGAAYNGGTYVLSATNGTNGIIYTTNTPSTNNSYPTRLSTQVPLNSITFGNNTYVAVGNSGIIYSTTAPTGLWNGRVSGTTANLLKVYFDGTAFWAVGTTGIILTSNDGVSWSRPGLNSITYQRNLGTFIAVGINGLIYTSTNLTSWTRQTSNTTQKLNYVACVLPPPSNNLCLAVGNSGTILSSTNGTTWSNTTASSSNLNAFTCGKICVIVGNNGTVLTNSTLALTGWTAQNSTTTVNLNSVAYNGTYYIAVGDLGVIRYSADGITWYTPQNTIANRLNSIACGNSGCIAVGNNGAVTFSTLGETWNTQTAFTTNNLNAISHFGGIYTVVGESNTVYTYNGSTWTARTSGVANTNTNFNFIYNY